MTSIGRRYEIATDAAFGTTRGAVRALLAELAYVFGTVDEFVQFDPLGVERLVFVCLGNINRSAFAHGLAASAGARCASIGLSTTTGAPAFPKAVSTAARFGIALDGHRATNFPDYALHPGDLLLAMEIRHARELVRRGVPAGQIALLGHWGAPRRLHIHDPHVLSDRYFTSCFRILEGAVDGLIRSLQAAGSPCMSA